MVNPSTPGRTIAIGDIHGCSGALRALLDAISLEPSDTLVVLGDFIDRGDDSRGVLEMLLDTSKRCRLVSLLGNHEEMLLATRIDPDSVAALSAWLRDGGLATLQSYGQSASPRDLPEQHVSFIEGCIEFYETETHIFVHANYDPNRPLNEQTPYTLHWESLHRRTPERHVSGKTVVVGHTAQKKGEILDRGYLKCIDTYCYGGGWLTALDDVAGQLWQAREDGEIRQRRTFASA